MRNINDSGIKEINQMLDSYGVIYCPWLLLYRGSFANALLLKLEIGERH